MSYLHLFALLSRCVFSNETCCPLIALLEASKSDQNKLKPCVFDAIGMNQDWEYFAKQDAKS
jgi:hypothetical protein